MINRGLSNRRYNVWTYHLHTDVTPSSLMSRYMSSETNSVPVLSSNSLENKPKSNIMNNIQNLLRGRGWDGTSVLLSKESLAKLGLNVLLAYGFVSNFSYVTCLILSWVSHGRMYGLSPTAPGQWKSFLLIYSGFFAANNILRPLRFSLSIAISPLFMRFVEKIQALLKVNKAVATACVVFLVNVVGTTSYLVFGLIAATRIANVPLF